MRWLPPRMLLILLRIYAKMQISAGTRAHAPPRNDRFNSAGVGESSSSHFADESSRQQRRVIGKLQGFDSRFIGRDRSTARAAAWETQVKVADAARQWQCRPYLEGALMLLTPPTSSHLLPLRSSVFVLHCFQAVERPQPPFFSLWRGFLWSTCTCDRSLPTLGAWGGRGGSG